MTKASDNLVERLLHDWQAERSEWHGPVTLEVVREYATWREARIETLTASLELVKGALEPFARIGGDILPSIPDDRHIYMAGIRGDRTATAGEYRAARTALANAAEALGEGL